MTENTPWRDASEVFGDRISRVAGLVPEFSWRSSDIPEGVRVDLGGQITIEYKNRPLEYSIYRQQEQHQGRVIAAKLLAAPLSRVPPPKKTQRLVPLSHPWHALILPRP